jgi:D-alanyl-D-alanine carboxypeptidase
MILRLFLVILILSGQSLLYARKFAAIVVDGTTHNILYGYNEKEQCHPASLTKKMTLYVLFEALANKRITMGTKFVVSPYAAAQAPSKLGTPAGELVTVEVIIKSLITRSANDMAVVAAEGLMGSVQNFVNYMNVKAHQLGMKSTAFYNPNGLPDKRHTSTAYDMVALGIALYRDFPQFVHYFKLKSFNYKGNIIKTHNHMLDSFYGLDGIKTGYTNASGFNISTSAVRYTANGSPHRIFAVVMGGDSRHTRDRKAAEILEVGFQRLGLIKNNNASSHLEEMIESASASQRYDYPRKLISKSSKSRKKIKKKK